jgi:hypothetical protein
MNDIFLVVRALKEVVSEPHWYDVDCVDEGYRAALRLEQLKPVGEIIESSFFDKTNKLTHFYEAQPPVGTKLYTAPPPKKEWVGLTQEDKELLITLHAPPIHPDFSEDDSFDDLLRKHEAKLKEKNA